MRRWRIFTARQAEEDAAEICSYIAKDNPQAANSFLDAIEAAANLLSATPEIGSPRYFEHPQLQGLRFHPLNKFENYLLFYRTLDAEEVVEIVRIVHGSRDLPTLFGQEDKPIPH
jgi:toxin ParE1/3/4